MYYITVKQSPIKKLNVFNQKTKDLRKVPRHELYREFRIPKRSSGLRKIDAQQDELMKVLRELKGILKMIFTRYITLQHLHNLNNVLHSVSNMQGRSTWDRDVTRYTIESELKYFNGG